jgi:hypothetical protein
VKQVPQGEIRDGEGHGDAQNMAMLVGDGKEMLVKLRLFYLGVVYSMKDRMEVENETSGRESLERGGRC